MVSGWYESDNGADEILIETPMDNPLDLAEALYYLHGDDLVGVDMELEGEYTDGTDVSTTMTVLYDELQFICDTLTSK
jgi:hypothetical protein|tara:strand:+ start:192 stop:425 length:234 start_codon:yes stop_codon:yes gene_type:complete